MNAFDPFSAEALKFLLERTDFSEPWCGFGFATEMKRAVQAAYNAKFIHEPSREGHEGG